MERVDITPEEIKSRLLEFYDYKKWHFIAVNGVDLGDKLEIQYLFASYEEKDRIVMFAAPVAYDAPIPSITDIIPSAFVTEAETKDMFDANIQDTEYGLFLEKDGPKAPLRKQNMEGAKA